MATLKLPIRSERTTGTTMVNHHSYRFWPLRDDFPSVLVRGIRGEYIFPRNCINPLQDRRGPGCHPRVHEHVRNVSLKISRTCPENGHERVHERVLNSQYYMCPKRVYQSQVLNIYPLSIWEICSNASAYVSMIFSRTCPWYSLERVPRYSLERVHNVSANMSANVSDREPKMWQKNENNWFFEEKIQILVANALRKSEHF